MDAPVPPREDQTQDDRVGCLDIIAATTGMGCAMAVRTLIIVGAFALLVVLLKLTGFGSGTAHHQIPATATPVIRYGFDGWALVLPHLLHLEKKLRGPVMDKFHRGVDVFQ